jgi:hypothetical protein
MNGMSRAVATLLGAGIAGFMLWVAAQLGRHTTGSYWAAYGIVAAAGIVVAVSQLRGRGGNPPGTLLTAFVPVLVVAGWVLLAMQPHANWFRDHVLSWSGNMGVLDVVHDLATWLGVLAFGIGFTFGVSLEPGLAFSRRRKPVAEPARTPAPAYDRQAASEPTAAERSEVGDGATTTRERTPTAR